MALKYSRQREAIKEFMMSRKDHPTADVVYMNVRKEFPNISLGTVYRNLSFLAENGQILKISTGIGPDRFDGFTNLHNHFICKSCGNVMDLDYIPSETIIEKASNDFDEEIEECEMQFFGKCRKCLLNN